MTEQHPFVPWMVQRYGKYKTALGDLARQLQAMPDFPAIGDRVQLFDYLVSQELDGTALRAFSEGWLAFYTACLSPGCTIRTMSGSTYCTNHGGRRHYPEGT